jgi:hypothetical protein
MWPTHVVVQAERYQHLSRPAMQHRTIECNAGNTGTSENIPMRRFWLIGTGLLALVGCGSGSPSPRGAAGGAGAAAGTGGLAGQGGGGAGVQGGEAGSGPAGQNNGAAGEVPDSSAGGGAPDAGGGAPDAGGGAPDAGGGAPDTGGGAISDAAPTSDVAVPVGTRTNLALRKPATASSVEHAGHEPEMIDDGDQVTRWVGGSAVYPQWNQIDLQASHRIDTAVLYPYMARAYQFLLEGSLDGATYFTLTDRRDNTMGGEAITVSFAAQSARFVRITVVGASGYTAGWSAIDELQLYETP